MYRYSLAYIVLKVLTTRKNSRPNGKNLESLLLYNTFLTRLSFFFRRRARFIFSSGSLPVQNSATDLPTAQLVCSDGRPCHGATCCAEPLQRQTTDTAAIDTSVIGTATSWSIHRDFRNQFQQLSH